MIGFPSTTELTQGAIFTCAASEDYADVAPRGLVITARCDVAHGKAPVISYVPLIGFRAWLFQDGLRLVAARVLAASRAKMKAALRDAGLSESMLDTLSSQTLSAHLAELTDKAGRNAAKRFYDAEVQKDAAFAALEAEPGKRPAMDLFDAQQKEYQKMLQELLSNSVADYHFIECSEPEEECEGYVAILREIRYVPAALARELLEGIDFEAFKQLCIENPKYLNKLNIANQESYAMPVGIVRSPFIELFMQRFTNLFARIGVTDFSPDLMKSLRDIVPFKFGDMP